MVGRLSQTYPWDSRWHFCGCRLCSGLKKKAVHGNVYMRDDNNTYTVYSPRAMTLDVLFCPPFCRDPQLQGSTLPWANLPAGTTHSANSCTYVTCVILVTVYILRAMTLDILFFPPDPQLQGLTLPWANLPARTAHRVSTFKCQCVNFHTVSVKLTS